MKENTIKELISQKNWNSLVSSYSINEICFSLNFKEAMHLVEHLFYDDIRNDANQQFALKLTYEIKNHFKNEWDMDWKNDVFLASLCSMLWLYEEEYALYKNAYDKLKDPPAALLLLLAGCNSAPGSPPITDEESEFYLRKAIEKKITFEAALMMRSLYKDKGNELQAEYWDQMYQKLEKQNLHSDYLTPNVLK